MDDTPAPDLPDPASPTPATNCPAGGSRIRSQVPIVKSSRLPGTYAANSGEDMNWRRGVTVLWVLFGLAAVGEIFHGAFYLLAGHAGWPLNRDAVRVGVGSLVFLTLWLGWGWTRYLLVVVDFGFGIWMVVWSVAEHVAVGARPISAQQQMASSALIETLPELALGILYLVTAAYLAFSADMVDFARHRREEGRGWVFVPVLALAAVYTLVVLTLQLPYRIWLGVQERGAQQFGDDTVRAMAEHWDPQTLTDRGDEAFLRAFPPEFRKSSMASLSPFGGLQRLEEARANALPTTVDASGFGFVEQYSYDVKRVDFAHGHAHFSFFLTRGLLGPWKLDNFIVDQVAFDPKPTAGAAAPVVTGTPGGG